MPWLSSPNVTIKCHICTWAYETTNGVTLELCVVSLTHNFSHVSISLPLLFLSKLYSLPSPPPHDGPPTPGLSLKPISLWNPPTYQMHTCDSPSYASPILCINQARATFLLGYDSTLTACHPIRPGPPWGQGLSRLHHFCIPHHGARLMVFLNSEWMSWKVALGKVTITELYSFVSWNPRTTVRRSLLQ